LYLADSIVGFRGVDPLPAEEVEPAGCEWAGRCHVGHLRGVSHPPDAITPRGGSKPVRTPRADARSHIQPASALLSPLFALSQLQLKPSILKSYFFDSESIS
jgi:hypothetical protein